MPQGSRRRKPSTPYDPTSTMLDLEQEIRLLRELIAELSKDLSANQYYILSTCLGLARLIYVQSRIGGNTSDIERTIIAGSNAALDLSVLGGEAAQTIAPEIPCLQFPTPDNPALNSRRRAPATNH